MLTYFKRHFPECSDAFCRAMCGAFRSGQGTRRRTLVACLARIYTGVGITRATLKLYVNDVTEAGSFNVDYVNGTWSESTIDASAPALGSTIAASVPLTTADKNQYILIDVTAAGQEWLSGTANDGIALVGNSPLNATFDSEESATTSHSAELDTVFTPGSGGGGMAGIITNSAVDGQRLGMRFSGHRHGHQRRQ